MPNRPDGYLEETFVTSTKKPPGRRLWTRCPELTQATWATIFLDAELYLESVNAVPVLRQLEAAGRIPPTISVFVSSLNAAARHFDYTCDEDYGRFLSQDVIPSLFDRNPGLKGRCVTIVGLSLSGLAAAHAALTQPNQFSAAICQSPSFWWNNERFCSSVPQATGSPPSFWISVGNQETKRGVSHPPSGMLQLTSQIEACERGCTALTVAKYNVNYRVFDGGHEFERWREDLPLALPWAAKEACTKRNAG